MTNNVLPSLGPCVFASLVTNDLDRAVTAYGEYLQLRPAADSSGRVSAAQAELWACPALAGLRCEVLYNALGEPCLRLVEDPGVDRPASRSALDYHGWLALEIVVEDVDALVDTMVQAEDSGFDVLRPAADLELSEHIRASQIAGPCGEVLYLTRIDGAVPPFDLPRARCAVDRLFIPVLSVPARREALAFYRRFPGTTSLEFETRITVVNQAFGLPLEHRHPVATVALRGQSLIEIDQLAPARARPALPGRLPAGIASVTFEVDSFAALEEQGLSPSQQPLEIPDAPYNGRRVAVMRGHAGELLELIERT